MNKILETIGWIKRKVRTREGRVHETYIRMVKRVSGKTPRKNYTGMPICSYEFFKNFSLKDPNFNQIFVKWEESGYLKTLAPSIDRIDKAKGYVDGNMQWLPVGEHTAKDNILGAVRAIDPATGKVVYEFSHANHPSLLSAGFTPSCIYRVISGERNTHKELKWERI